MRIYVGTKIIQAEPMDLAAFNATVRGIDVVEQDKTVLGYKVIYPPFRLGDDSYVSWSPKDVFENAYREITESEANVTRQGNIPCEGGVVSNEKEKQ